MPLTKEELKEAKFVIMLKIYRLKKQIEYTTDPREKRKLQRKLKELQYLQLWHQDLLERIE